MDSNQQKVAAFHRKFGHPVADQPSLLSSGRAHLRACLAYEEALEVEEAIYEAVEPGSQSSATGEEADSIARLARLAEELADKVIIDYGTACEAGIDLGPVIAAKMASNMTKSQDKRADGKILKGADYTPPDIEAVIRAQPEGAME